MPADPPSSRPDDTPTRLDAGISARAATPPTDLSSAGRSSAGEASAAGGKSEGSMPMEFGEEICPLDPGEKCGSRYRLIEKIGSGGMGEVWKARDEALAQVVALKFLGGPFLDSGGRGVELLRNEVRLARRVAHQNVCRVHDLGQVADKTFLSMEFVDGEPLDTLLQRIGRPTPAKCREIARQIAAGLHAAHEQGVLHRDLKPGNVMLDGRGDARLTDFGIAGMARDAEEQRDGAGTPAYMAPELFEDQPASVASDLWSLGALLFELYTGERYIRANDFTELRKEHRRPPRVESDLPRDIEPEISVLLRDLLDKDPARRPPSALAVVSRLTGGNLLEEVLRAGRTPSPDLIAAAKINEEQRCGRTVFALIALFLTALVVVFSFEADVKLLARTPLPESGEVLESLARRSLESLQAVPSEGDRASGFDVNGDYLAALVSAEVGEDAMVGMLDRRLEDEDARIGLVDFWYRTTPRRERAWSGKSESVPLVADHLSGIVSWADPPLTIPGMVRARFDARGRLFELDVLPPELTGPPAVADGGPEPRSYQSRDRIEDGRERVPAAELHRRLFEAVGIDSAQSVEVDAAWLTPLADVDELRAWRDDAGHRVELGTKDGFVVHVRVFEEAWSELAGYSAMRWKPGMSGPLKLLRGFMLLLAVVLAARALRRKRADLKGAMRLGLGVFGLVLLVTLLTGNHSTRLGAEGQLWLRGMARGLLVAVQYVAFYLALESHVRRLWPETMIAWTRLLRGQFGDPAVGFSLVSGIAFGTLGAAMLYVGRMLPAWLEGKTVMPLVVRARAVEVLDGPTQSVGSVLEMLVYYADLGMAVVLGLVALRYVLRGPWPAGIAMVVLLGGGWGLTIPQPTWPQLLVLLGMSAVVVVLSTRVGLLGLMAGLVAFRVVTAFPMTTELDHWLGRATLFATALLVGLVAFGAWRSLRETLLGARVRASSQLTGMTPGP